MFVETVTAPREEWERWTENLETLVAAVAWVGVDGLVTALIVWDSAEAVGAFYVERVHAIVQAQGGEPPNRPERHGEPIAVYIRR